ncbi:OB-fold domain-containing protein [Pigmentiphaga soli]|uniref:OB-fold domain-containing protein n=2 Tax=Pigmentiphaga soli TaxID=1007095 RepID=A0ABP8HNB8_9BURK
MASRMAGSEAAGPEKTWREALGSGEFLIQQCMACGKYGFFPRTGCRHCGSPQLGWAVPAGGASVYSTTVVRRKAEDGGDYNVAIVELDEGPRLMSRVDGMPPAAVEIGLRVRARVRGEGADAMLVFVPE